MTECEVTPDRTWKDQYHCGVHDVWFRDTIHPCLCPAGAEAEKERARLADLERLYLARGEAMEARDEKLAKLEPLMRLVDPLRDIAGMYPAQHTLWHAVRTAMRALKVIGEFQGEPEPSAVLWSGPWSEPRIRQALVLLQAPTTQRTPEVVAAIAALKGES